MEYSDQEIAAFRVFENPKAYVRESPHRGQFSAKFKRILRQIEQDEGAQQALMYAETILGGHGIGYYFDNRKTCQGIAYVEMGDLYVPTVAFDYRRGCFLWQTIADAIERQPRRFGS